MLPESKFSSSPTTQALSVRALCKLNSISLSTYRKLKARGLGPATLKVGSGEVGSREVITPGATAEWGIRMAERPATKPQARKESAGFVLVRVTRKTASILSTHPTFEAAEAAMVASYPDDPSIQIHERLVRVVEGRSHA